MGNAVRLWWPCRVNRCTTGLFCASAGSPFLFGHFLEQLRASRGEVPENVVNREVLSRAGFRAKLARFVENRA